VVARKVCISELSQEAESLLLAKFTSPYEEMEDQLLAGH
jgi:hypothetical protein